MIVKLISLSTDGLALGRRPDISKDMSWISGTVIDLIEGEACNTKDS